MGPKLTHRAPKSFKVGGELIEIDFGPWGLFLVFDFGHKKYSYWLQKVSFWAPSAPGGKHFRKNDPGIWNLTWNYENMKVVPQNSVQNPGLEIFRYLLCVRKQAFPFTVIYICFSRSVPLETPPEQLSG